MVTNYPHGLTVTQRPRAGHDGRTSSGPLAWVLARLDQLLCGFRGHDEVLHFRDKRLHLRCTSCGYLSPGWEVGQRPPRIRYEGDARRHLLAPPARSRVVIRKTA